MKSNLEKGIEFYDKHDNQQPPLLKCFVNGQCQTLSIEQAHRKLWQANYGWLAPVNWYRWHIEGYQGSEYLLQKVTPQPVWFALNVHLSQCLITIDDCEHMLNEINMRRNEFNGKKVDTIELDENNFVAWAARFHKLFKCKDGKENLPKEFWPLHFEPVFIGPYRQRRPAYRIRRGKSYVVIDGVHPDFDQTDSIIAWNQFLKLPGKQAT